MKKLISFVYLLVFCFSAGFTQQNQPTISFEKDVHDFGKINEEDGKVSVKFQFVNTGAKPLLIKNVRASCGCTTPNWTKKPVLPGEKGFVSAVYNPANRPGIFQKTVTVNSNAKNSTVILKIKGEVVARKKTITDKYPHRMGNLLLKSNHIPLMRIFNDQTITKEQGIANNSDAPMTVTFKRVPEHITIKTVPATLKPKQEGKIVLTYDAKAKNDWDYVFDNLHVYINGEHNPAHYLTISANITENFSKLTPEQRANAPRIEFKSKEFNFGTIKQNEQVSYAYEFTNTGKSNLEIRKLKASCGCTAARPDKEVVKPGETAKIKVTFNSRGKSGKQNKVVTVITNDPNNQRVILFIKGVVETP